MRKVHLHTAIALRNIFRQPRRSGLTVLAIAFSVFCVIVFQALKVGMDQKMIDSALRLDLGTMQIDRGGYEANVTLFQTLPEFDKLLKILQESGLTSYSLRIKAPALILAGQRSSSVLLSGIRPEQEKNFTLIHRRLTAGGHRPADKDSLLIGQRLADNLKLRVGDDVSLTRRMVPETKTSPAIRFEYFKAPVVAPLPARNPGLDAARLAAVRDGVRADLDTLSEMSETTSLRLQAAMERRSKFIETLSRIMKKIGSTQETLVQNLK